VLAFALSLVCASFCFVGWLTLAGLSACPLSCTLAPPHSCTSTKTATRTESKSTAFKDWVKQQVSAAHKDQAPGQVDSEAYSAAEVQRKTPLGDSEPMVLDTPVRWCASETADDWGEGGGAYANTSTPVATPAVDKVDKGMQRVSVPFTPVQPVVCDEVSLSVEEDVGRAVYPSDTLASLASNKAPGGAALASNKTPGGAAAPTEDDETQAAGGEEEKRDWARISWERDWTSDTSRGASLAPSDVDMESSAQSVVGSSEESVRCIPLALLSCRCTTLHMARLAFLQFCSSAHLASAPLPAPMPH
jgi:hypothetical protein